MSAPLTAREETALRASLAPHGQQNIAGRMYLRLLATLDRERADHENTTAALAACSHMYNDRERAARPSVEEVAEAINGIAQAHTACIDPACTIFGMKAKDWAMVLLDRLYSTPAKPEPGIERLEAVAAAASILVRTSHAIMPDRSPYGCPHGRDWLDGLFDDLREALAAAYESTEAEEADRGA